MKILVPALIVTVIALAPAVTFAQGSAAGAPAGNSAVFTAPGPLLADNDADDQDDYGDDNDNDNDYGDDNDSDYGDDNDDADDNDDNDYGDDNDDDDDDDGDTD